MNLKIDLKDRTITEIELRDAIKNDAIAQFCIAEYSGKFAVIVRLTWKKRKGARFIDCETSS